MHNPSARPAASSVLGLVLTCLIILPALVSAAAGNRVVAWGAGAVTNAADGYDFGQAIVPASLTNAVCLAGGGLHSLALRSNASLQGWGDNQLGETALPATSNYLAIACGFFHSLALQTNGLVVAAGDDSAGQIDLPANLSNVVAIACGFYHSLALESNGVVLAWGTSSDTNVIKSNDGVDYGQSLVPAGLSNVVAIAGGGFHSLALKSDGTVAAWGYNYYGETNLPPGLSNVVAIAAGAAHNLVLKANGTVVAWGENLFGQTNVPAGLSNVVAIAAGGWHNLALKSDGTVVAWGAGTGNNTNVDFQQCTVPAGLTNVIQIAAGVVHSLALVGSAPPVVKAPLSVAGYKTNTFTATLPTRNGRVYCLEYASSLTNQTWSSFPLQPGNGGALRFVDPSASAKQRFYRVNQW